MLLAGLILAAGVASGTAQSAAPDEAGVTLGISPAINEIGINRGEAIHRELIIENKAGTPAAIRLHSENFEASDPYGAISFNSDDTRQYAASTWIKLAASNLVLAPRQRTTLSYELACPPDAEPGGHYATIFLEPAMAASGSTNSTIGITQRVGALLFITVGGHTVEQGQVLGASTKGACNTWQCSFKTDRWREWGPVPFIFQFANTGTVHVSVAGAITVKDIFGRNAGSVDILPKTVLPGSSRSFAVTWPREILLGPYTATLKLTYGAQHRTDTTTLSFWVIPWRGLAIAMAVGLAAGLRIFVRRSRKQPKIH